MPIPQGVEKEQALKLGGATDDQINAWKADTYKSLQQGGADPKAINDYFGVKEPDTSAMKDYVKANVAQYKEDNKPNPDAPIKVDQDPVGSYYDAFKYGLQISTTGLALRGKMPDKVMPKHADNAMAILENIGQFAGDLPTYAEGMVAGGLGGAAAAGPIGGAVGAAAGGWALPPTLRKILIDHYQKGDIQDPQDFLNRLSAASWEAIKGATTGVVTEMTGGLAGKAVSKVAAPFMATMAQTTAEVAAMTTTNAAMEGHMPTRDEFINAGVVVAGLHGAGMAAGHLMGKYAENGAKPGDLAIESGKDPVLKQELLQQPKVPNPDVPLEPEKLYQDSEDHTDAEKHILSHIVKGDRELPTKTWKESWQEFRANNLDYGEALKNAGADTAYKLLRRFGDYRSKVMDFFNNGAREFNRTGTGDTIPGAEGPFKIINDMLKETGDEDESKFVAYWAAKRAVELDARGIETPFMKTKEGAALTRQAVREGKSTYDSYVNRMVEAKNQVLDYYAKSLGLPDDKVAAIKDLNKAHFPFHKMQEVDPLTGKTGGPTGKGLKKIFGSSQDVIDPLLSTFKDMEMLIREADMNNIKRTAWEQLGPEEKGGAGFLREVEQPMKRITVSAEEVNKNPDAVMMNDSTLDIFRPADQVLRPDQEQVYVDGNKVVMEGDPGVIDSMKRIGGDSAHMGIWTNLMKAFSTGVRIMTVGNPMFGGRHIWRSQRSAALYSKTGMDTFISAISNWNEASPSNAMWRNFWADGGGVSSFDRMDRTYLENNVFDTNKQVPFINKAWNVMKNPIKSMMNLTEHAIMTTDNMSRFTEYKRTIEQGGTRADAAYNARQVVADYQRVGARNSAIRGTTAFLNVHMQVTDRAVSELLDNPKEFLPKILAGVTAPAILLWLANHDDERIKEAPNYIRNLYWQFPMDHFKDVKDANDLNSFTIMPDQLKRTLPDGTRQINDGPVMRLPGEGEPFMVFGSMVSAALDSAYKKDPAVMGQWAKDALSQLVPLPIPTMVKPIAEQALNHNFLTNRSLVSAQNEKQMPAEQYESYTSEVAKQLGKQIGYIPYVGKTSFASPVVIDNYIRGWGGGLGQYAVQLADAGLHAAGIGNTFIGADGKPVLDEKGQEIKIGAPTWSAQEMPFLREMMVKYPDMRAASIEEFNNRALQASQILNSSKKEFKNMNPYEAMQIRQNYGSLAPKVDQISKSISKAKQTIQLAIVNPTMSPDDKRQLINTMIFQSMSMAHRGNQLMDEFEKNMKDNQSQGANP